MATFQEVKAFIDDKIKDNENGEITGSVLNEALTLLLNVKVEGGGGGGSIDPAILEDYAPILRDFSDDFNNDFTN